MMVQVNDTEDPSPTMKAEFEGRADSKPDTPEDLIRNDTRWINFLRGLLIGTLVVVAAGTAYAAYKVASKWEYSTFLREFESVALRISQTFLRDADLKIWIASFALNTLVTPNSSSAMIDVNMERFAELYRGSQQIASARRLGFSPVLRDSAELQTWEHYARQIEKTELSTAAREVCMICGDGMEVGSPNAVVTIPTMGGYPCSVLEEAALQGIITANTCPAILGLTKASCACKPSAGPSQSNNTEDSKFSNHTFKIENGTGVAVDHPGPFSPIWRLMPQPPNSALLYDQMAVPSRRRALSDTMKYSLATFSAMAYPLDYNKLLGDSTTEPLTTLFFPVHDTQSPKTVIGAFFVDFQWSYFLTHTVPARSDGIIFVIENNRGQQFTYQIKSNFVYLLGEGDLHDSAFDSIAQESTFDAFVALIRETSLGANDHDIKNGVLYNIRIYPSQTFLRQYTTNRPAIYASVVVAIFVFTSLMFLAYDIFVGRRQTKVMESAMQTNAIVSSLFPESIKSRLLGGAISFNRGTTKPRHGNGFSPLHFAAPKSQLRTMLNGSSNLMKIAYDHAEPIADFFPNVTIIFADISGFTAWSSEREPGQVFQLLEAAYQTFDKIANRLGVFKVETIGDCYVAVTGLPEPQADHAVRMARFAYEIMIHMHELASTLESSLGPDTGSLSIRIGLHSGQVIGGVLRGEKARFQLFGDTMNTAARMQSTGQVNMIQASNATAELLLQAGEGAWLRKREKPVVVKGKGEMQTYWVDPTFVVTSTKERRLSSESSATSSHLTAGANSNTWGDSHIDIAPNKTSKGTKLDRLVDWNTDLLLRFLQKVVAVRNATRRKQSLRRGLSRRHSLSRISDKPILDVTEVIEMSEFCEKTAHDESNSDGVEIGQQARMQLRHYVQRIAAMYHDNPFHNFEHASHVAMSASKIVKRIVKPDNVDYHQEALRKRNRKKAVAREIHNSTFGIGSDALMQFAVVFSAVIHDVDHRGVSNAQLIREADEVAAKFDGKCVLEQNSVQIAWSLLMEEQYEDLRSTIFGSDEEKHRFRQLIVNAVIATDIADKELQTLRKDRWNKAFYEGQIDLRPTHGEETSCKATVVFEYIIQASDVAHTMQHWQVYNKWNERLFKERYLAFLAGREESDPSLSWYDGEIWFFDNYIIPLARRLETCGVFGVSSDEYLNYALENRHEWGRKGRSVVSRMVRKYSVSTNMQGKDIGFLLGVDEEKDELDHDVHTGVDEDVRVLRNDSFR